MEINATIFVQIFFIMILLLWLSRSLFAPIMRLFDERERRIVGARAESADLSKRALEKAQAFDQELKEARLSARQVLTDLKHQADNEQAEMLLQVRMQAKARLHESEQALAVEESKVRSELALATDVMADEIVKALMMKRA